MQKLKPEHQRRAMVTLRNHQPIKTP